jgi:hypothetical protein
MPAMTTESSHPAPRGEGGSSKACYRKGLAYYETSQMAYDVGGDFWHDVREIVALTKGMLDLSLFSSRDYEGLYYLRRNAM